ncbi:helix-turn-helix domain-containing protein [Parafrankia colletiae]|uniref:helix-turn-helix domain-containing protein n=1 Tax=Parafrankia colletiae TaxID=573497 RepID=UPI0038990908
MTEPGTPEPGTPERDVPMQGAPAPGASGAPRASGDPDAGGSPQLSPDLPLPGPVAPDSVGQTLVAARHAAGLTVEDVSDRTRIRAALIGQIERNDFSNCGGAVYARGHLRTIATTLGLDPVPLLAAYDAGHERVPSPVVVASPEFDPLHGGGGGGGGRRRGGFRWAPAMIVSLVVVCLFALVALLLPSGGDGEDTVAQRPSAPPSTAPVAAPPTPSPAPATSQPPGVNVRVEARDAQSWLEVRDEGGELFQLLLEQGDSREVSSEGTLEIKMGNAGAVDLSCNGRNLGPAGAPGQVVTVRLTLAASGGGCTMGDDQATGLAAPNLRSPAGRPGR